MNPFLWRWKGEWDFYMCSFQTPTLLTMNTYLIMICIPYGNLIQIFHLAFLRILKFYLRTFDI